MYSEEVYVPVVAAFEEPVTACHSLIAYRSSSTLYLLRLVQQRIGYSCLRCPFYADSATTPGAQVSFSCKPKL